MDLRVEATARVLDGRPNPALKKIKGRTLLAKQLGDLQTAPFVVRLRDLAKQRQERGNRKSLLGCGAGRSNLLRATGVPVADQPRWA